MAIFDIIENHSAIYLVLIEARFYQKYAMPDGDIWSSDNTIAYDYVVRIPARYVNYLIRNLHICIIPSCDNFYVERKFHFLDRNVASLFWFYDFSANSQSTMLRLNMIIY